jgi:hypothetical protein
VRDGALDTWNSEEILLCFFYALGNRCRNFLCLAVANANLAIAVTDNYKCGEAKATTTLDYLGYAVDCDNSLDKSALLGRCLIATIVISTVAALVTFALVAASLISSHNYCFLFPLA